MTWSPERVVVEREKWERRKAETGTGVPCEVCGLDGTNITHDPPWYREGNDYYVEFPDTENHEFVGPIGVEDRTRKPRSGSGHGQSAEYLRGYQAGYHAGIRDRQKALR